MDLQSSPAALSFSHVGIYVSDLRVMAAFYSRVLGMVVTDRGALPGADLIFLSRDPSEHHQLVLCSGRPVDLAFTTINQISWRLTGFDALRAAHASLIAAGAGDVQPIDHGISWSIYARDPEGNRLELFMDTPWYVPQPLREALDLSLDDDEILRDSEARCTSLPGCKPMRQWREETARRIEAALAA